MLFISPNIILSIYLNTEWRDWKYRSETCPTYDSQSEIKIYSIVPGMNFTERQKGHVWFTISKVLTCLLEILWVDSLGNRHFDLSILYMLGVWPKRYWLSQLVSSFDGRLSVSYWDVWWVGSDLILWVETGPAVKDNILKVRGIFIVVHSFPFRVTSPNSLQSIDLHISPFMEKYSLSF